MQRGYEAEKALGYRQFAAASIDTAQLLSAIPGGIPDGAVLARIVAEAQAIRYRDDGTAPTTTVGQPLAVGVELYYTAHNFGTLRVIGQAANAVLNVTFYGHGA